MKHIIIISVLVIIIAYMSRNKILKTIFSEQLSQNFQLGELLVTTQPFPNIPNEREKENLRLLTVKVLQKVRDLLGVPVGINSAFRSDKVNKAVGGVDNSQHRLGLAADLRITAIPLMEAFTKIARSSIPFDQLIIEKDKEGDMWIHISYNPNGGRRQLLQADWNFSKNKMDYKTLTV